MEIKKSELKKNELKNRIKKNAMKIIIAKYIKQNTGHKIKKNIYI